jgi:hypothetical protein
MLQRQRVGGEDLVAHDVGHRHFGGRDQVERLVIARSTLNRSSSNFGSWPVPNMLGVDQIGRVALGVAVLFGVQYRA